MTRSLKEWGYNRPDRSAEAYKRGRGCSTKIAYRNERVATRAGEGLGLYPYACLYCKCWHLTKTAPTEKKPAAKHAASESNRTKKRRERHKRARARAAVEKLAQLQAAEKAARSAPEIIRIGKIVRRVDKPDPFGEQVKAPVVDPFPTRRGKSRMLEAMPRRPKEAATGGLSVDAVIFDESSRFRTAPQSARPGFEICPMQSDNAHGKAERSEDGSGPETATKKR